MTNLNTELGPKRLELLRELIPTANIIALLVNPTSPFITESISRDLQSAARTLGLQLHILNASTERDFDTVFATFAQLRADALVIAPDAMFISRSEQLGALTLRHAVPAITQFREFAAAGGLMSYGGSFTEAARQVGVYTGRILKGEKPADLPVQQSTKVELIINLKTAKALGLTVPQHAARPRRRGDRMKWRECPLLAQSGHTDCTAHVRFRGKADSGRTCPRCPVMTKSRHRRARQQDTFFSINFTKLTQTTRNKPPL